MELNQHNWSWRGFYVFMFFFLHVFFYVMFSVSSPTLGHLNPFGFLSDSRAPCDYYSTNALETLQTTKKLCRLALAGCFFFGSVSHVCGDSGISVKDWCWCVNPSWTQAIHPISILCPLPTIQWIPKSIPPCWDFTQAICMAKPSFKIRFVGKRPHTSNITSQSRTLPVASVLLSMLVACNFISHAGLDHNGSWYKRMANG